MYKCLYTNPEPHGYLTEAKICHADSNRSKGKTAGMDQIHSGCCYVIMLLCYSTLHSVFTDNRTMSHYRHE